MAELLVLPQFPPGEIIVEIATEKNRRQVFGPAGDKPLRGRWNQLEHIGRMGDAFGTLLGAGVLPGIRIGIDLENRTVRTFDPLATPEFAETMRIIKQSAKEQPLMYGAADVNPWPEVRKTCDDLSPQDTADLLKDWLYWTRRLIDDKHAILIKGELPPLKVIRELFPGRRRRNHLSEFGGEGDGWADNVPLSKGKQEGAKSDGNKTAA